MSPTLLRRTITVVVTIIIIVAVLLFAARIPRTIALFLIAAFVAFGTHPLVKWLERWMPRPAGIAVVYVALIGVLVVLALVVVPITYEQVVAFVAGTPQYVALLHDVAGHVQQWMRDVLGSRARIPSLDQLENEAANRISLFATGAISQLGTIVVGAVSAMIIGTSALILSVFFLLQGSEVRDGILAFVPPRRRPEVSALLHELAEVFGRFVAGQALLCGIVGVAVWLLLAPAHFAFALLVAVVCALGYAVPFVGMIVAQVIAALLAAPQGTGMVVWVTVAIFVIARVADNVLVPRIMSQSMGVSPITVMFAVFAGGELFGLPGLILGIPAAALLKVLFGYFVQPYVVRMQTQADGGANVHVDVETTTPETVVVAIEPASTAATSTPVN
jgi:predicted PurR-regulated permease PerM